MFVHEPERYLFVMLEVLWCGRFRTVREDHEIHHDVVVLLCPLSPPQGLSFILHDECPFGLLQVYSVIQFVLRRDVLHVAVYYFSHVWASCFKFATNSIPFVFVMRQREVRYLSNVERGRGINVTTNMLFSFLCADLTV